jgi:hypothetical protein
MPATTNWVHAVVAAIYLAEGGERAAKPYGIMSVPVRDKEHARRVCEQTVVNNYRRWVQAGRPGPFIDFLGNRYCPPSVDPGGNRNWKRNVRILLSK